MNSKGLSQATRGNDTSYYVFFPGSITTRLFSSQKYTSLTLKSDKARELRYSPATSFNLGVGATYHNLSINLAYGFGLFKNRRAQQGKTKYLDLQGHLYKPKWITDFYGQVYKGYHIYPEGYIVKDPNSYYHRPDVSVTLFGLARYRIFNPNRFSYRAAFLQNEWQKRSAGSFLLGAEAYYGILKGDSNLVPAAVGANFAQTGINKVNYMSIGPGGGYTYTLVLLHHLFVTASLTANLNFNLVTEHADNNKNNHFSIQPVTGFHLAAGYNSRIWSVSGSFTGNNIPFRGNNSDSRYSLNTGNYRFIVARRFMPGKKLQKKLAFMNKVAKE